MALRVFYIVSSLRFCCLQFLGSALYGALSGYGESDMCRYISCPFGQYCWNGNCISTGGSLGGLGGLGAYGGMGGGLGTLASAAALYGGAGASNLYTKVNQPPVQSLGSLTPITMSGLTPSSVGGLMPCSLMQQCLNGQICVNGYCSRSNVAFSGSQALPAQTTCAMGAVCPVGQYCIGGQCIQNVMASTFACQNGVSCPMGMMCQLGRCITNGLAMFGKK